mmetsp:Transcript_64416/g.170622  ORF Transcript_64416/g.170622 Transcript_64416/m.170622 type:complete len:94 (+) Transcript_64416:3-284(+)
MRSIRDSLPYLLSGARNVVAHREHFPQGGCNADSPRESLHPCGHDLSFEGLRARSLHSTGVLPARVTPDDFVHNYFEQSIQEVHESMQDSVSF